MTTITGLCPVIFLLPERGNRIPHLFFVSIYKIHKILKNSCNYFRMHAGGGTI